MPHKPKNSSLTVLKVRLGRRSRDLWTLGQLLFGLVLVLAMVAAVQVGFCRLEHPGRSVMACLRPMGDFR